MKNKKYKYKKSLKKYSEWFKNVKEDIRDKQFKD